MGCTLLWCQGDSALWWMELMCFSRLCSLSSVCENCVPIRTRCNFSASTQESISAAFGRSDWRVHQKKSKYTNLVAMFYAELLTPSFSVLLVFGKCIFWGGNLKSLSTLCKSSWHNRWAHSADAKLLIWGGNQAGINKTLCKTAFQMWKFLKPQCYGLPMSQYNEVAVCNGLKKITCFICVLITLLLKLSSQLHFHPDSAKTKAGFRCSNSSRLQNSSTKLWWQTSC